jgi:hypothetical protein
MKKLFYLLFMFGLWIPRIQAQTTNDVLRGWFENLQQAPDPAPFLIDMVARQTEDNWFVAKNYEDTNTINNWWAIYYEMQQASYQQGLLPETFNLMYQAKNLTKNDTIPIGILDLEFNEFKLEALTDSGVYFGWDDFGFWDIPGRTNHPYMMNMENPSRGTRKDVFVVSPLEAISEFRDVVFKIDPEFIFYSMPYNSETQPPPIHDVEIDFGDGNGWRSINPFQTQFFNITYQTVGQYVIKVRVGGDNDIRHAMAKFAVTSPQKRKNPDELITHIEGIEAGIYYPCDGDSNFTKLIIAVSGYDFAENKKVPHAYNQLIRESQIMMLHNYGYAVVVVDFHDSKKLVQDNANSLISLIEFLKCHRSEHIEHNFVMASISLGSVVARYALATMETPAYKYAAAQNPNYCHPEQGHNVRLWLALETENEGAFIPMGAQALLKIGHEKLQDAKKLSSFMVDKMMVDLDWGYKNLLQREATKQLLMFHVDSTDGTGQFFRQTLGVQLQAELDALGYPKDCKTVALTNAITDGKRQVAYVDIEAQEGLTYMDLALNFDLSILKLFKLSHSLEIQVNEVNEYGFGQIAKMHLSYPALYDHPVGCIIAIMAKLITCHKPPLWPLCIPATIAVNYCLNGQSHITETAFAHNTVPHGIMQGGAVHYAEMAHKNRTGNPALYTATVGAIGGVFGMPSVPITIPLLTLDYSQHTNTNSGMSTGQGSLKIIGLPIGNGGFVLKTEATAINFVPWYSALGYVRYDSLNQDLTNTPIDSNLARVPFDIIIGRPVSPDFPKSHVLENNGEQHHSHFYFRKDEVDTALNLTLLTREIGETYMHLDNQTINRKSWFEAEHDLNAGIEANPEWNYPDRGPIVGKPIYGQWSKDSGFYVTGSHGYAYLRAGREIRLHPGFSVSDSGQLHAWIEPMDVCTYTLAELDSLYAMAMVMPFSPKWDVDKDFEDLSAEVDVTESISLDNQWAVYPNPARDVIKIKAPNSAKYNLLSTEGMVIETGIFQEGENTIVISELRKGVYLLHIHQPNVLPLKIIKN